MTTLWEQARALHEDIERNEALVTKDLLDRGQKACLPSLFDVIRVVILKVFGVLQHQHVLRQDHRVDQLLEQNQKKCQELLRIYDDPAGYVGVVTTSLCC